MYTGYTHTRSSICKRSPTRKKEKKKKGKRKKNRDRTLVYVQRGEIPRPPSLFFRPRTTDIDKSREWPNRSAEWAYLRRFWSDIYQRLASSNLSTRTRRETLSSDRIKPGKISILASVLRFSNLWERRGGGGRARELQGKRGRGGFAGWARERISSRSGEFYSGRRPLLYRFPARVLLLHAKTWHNLLCKRLLM